MPNSSQKNKLGMIKFWSSKNFTNKAMYTLTGFEDIIDDEKYKDFLYCIDMAYDLIAPELSTENNQLKPSKALAAIAFEKPPKPQDYQKLIELSHTASVIELKQFLVQDIDHQPTEKVIDYLTFPLLAMMTSHLKPGPKTEVLLLKPQIIHKTLETVRLKTLKEILTENDLLVLRMKAPQEIKDDLKIKLNQLGNKKLIQKLKNLLKHSLKNLCTR